MYFMYFFALKLSSTSSNTLIFFRGFRASKRALRSGSVKVLKSSGSYNKKMFLKITTLIF